MAKEKTIYLLTIEDGGNFCAIVHQSAWTSREKAEKHSEKLVIEFTNKDRDYGFDYSFYSVTIDPFKLNNPEN